MGGGSLNPHTTNSYTLKACVSHCAGIKEEMHDILCLCLGVDVGAAKRLEEEQIMRDARTWLTDGPPAEIRHPRTGATPLHVAAAKGYLEALK